MQLPSERNPRREFLTCLAGMFSLAIGEGAYLVLIVSYLERTHTPVAITGTIMACLSILEATMSLGAGFVLRNGGVRRTVMLPVVVQAVSALILVFQPLGLPVWISAMINGAGMGVVGVGLYATILERRPAAFPLGSAIGWYTALIAAGNGLGAFLGGILTDKSGFPAAFGLSACGFVMVLPLMLMLPSAALPRYEGPEAAEPCTQDKGRPAGQAWVWILAVITGFTMSSINTAFETLFPIYGLRAGLTLTVIGSLSGLKAFLAAIIRPFSGAILKRVDALRANTLGLLSLAGTVILMPWAGMAAGLTAVVSAIGLAFGVSRVVSATLTLHGQPPGPIANKRISVYNSALCFGAIAGPWAGGWLASWMGLPLAIAVVPGVLLAAFLIAIVALPRMTAFGTRKGHTESTAL